MGLTKMRGLKVGHPDNRLDAPRTSQQHWDSVVHMWAGSRGLIVEHKRKPIDEVTID